MLGFFHRYFIEHKDERRNRLIYLRLCYPYEKFGLFKAGKSYMIRSNTKSQAYKWLAIIENHEKRDDFEVSYGSYTFRDYHDFYCQALELYLYSKVDLEEAYKYITRLNKKIEYLENRLLTIMPDYKSELIPEILA